jgi:hypothetical protein
VGERQHPHTAERSIGRTQFARRSVTDAGHADDRLTGQQCAVRVGQPLFGASGHARRQARRIGGFFKFESVPIAKHCSDFGEVRRHVQKSTPVGRLMRINRRSHHRAPVTGAVGNQREGIVQHQRNRREFPGQGWLPGEAGVDVMYGLAQIEVQVLAGAPAEAVHRRCGNRVAHHRDTDRGAESVTGRDHRVLPGERHLAACIGNR